MSTITETLKWVVDADVSKGVQGFGKTADAADKAEKSTGKLHSGFSNLTNAASDAAGAMLSPAGLVAGAAAVGTVALKSVEQFSKLGVEIGKVSDATGLTAEQASRWVEVANDAGVSTDSFSSLVGKLEKNLGNNVAALDKWGVAVVRAKDGSVDMNATLLNAIDVVNAIQDPTQKAAAGAAIFGKSWSSMAELIGRGSGQLKSDLESVQPSKIFTGGDVASARGVRDGFDAIKDAGEGLVLTLGRSLAPAVAKIAPLIGDLVSKAEPAIEELGSSFAELAESVGPAIESVSDLASALHTLGADSGALGTLDKMGISLSDLSLGAIPAAQKAWHQLTDAELDGSAALQGTTEKLAAQKQATEDSQTAADAYAESAKEFALHQQEVADATKRETEALKENKDALEADLKAQQDLVDAARAAADAGFAVTKATNDYTDSVKSLNDRVKDAKGDQNKIKEAYDDTTQAAEALADATVRQYDEQTTANGATLSATQKIDIWNGSMLNAANSASGPLRKAILDHIAAVNNIPTDVLTDIQAAIDKGDIDEANRLINTTSVTRTASVKADADDASLAATNRALDNVAHDRTVNFHAGSTKIYDSGGLVGRDGGLAAEKRPEFATINGKRVLLTSPTLVPPGTKVTGGADTERQLGQKWDVASSGGVEATGAASSGTTFGTGGGLSTVNVTVHMPPGSNGEDVIRAIKRYERMNGAGWRGG